MNTRIHIAGVPVDAILHTEAVQTASNFLEDGGSHLIVTPNPEMAVMAAGDSQFLAALNSADLALADGYGLKLLAPLFGHYVPEIISGTDFVFTLAKLCQEKNLSIYFLGGAGDVAIKASEHFKKLFPNLKIAGAESGGVIEYKNGEWQEDATLMKRIATAKPDLLFVALGHGKQECWIQDHLKQLPSVKIAIGIGGAFNYYAGTSVRPPEPIRNAHLEWLWRLFKEPKRASRIFTAVVIFPLLALKIRLGGVQ